MSSNAVNYSVEVENVFGPQVRDGYSKLTSTLFWSEETVERRSAYGCDRVCCDPIWRFKKG